MVLIEKVTDFLIELKKLYEESANPKKSTTVSLTIKKFIPRRRKQISEKLRIEGKPPRKHKPIPEKMRNQGILVRACDGYKRKLSLVIHTKNEMKNFENEYIEFFRGFVKKQEDMKKEKMEKKKDERLKIKKKKGQEEVEGEGEL